LQPQIARDGASADATVLGLLLGPPAVGALYIVLRPVKVSGGATAFIALATAVIAIIAAAVFGPLAALVAPGVGFALAFGVRFSETAS
jgi:hypothetical protein